MPKNIFRNFICYPVNGIWVSAVVFAGGDFTRRCEKFLSSRLDESDSG